MIRRTPWFLVLLLALVGCPNDSAPDAGVYPHELEWIRRWLTCEECIDNELDSVEAIGDRALPFLSTTMRTLPPGREENMERRLTDAATELGLTGLDATSFVDYHLANTVATTQGRSLVALVTLEAHELARMAADSLDAWDYRDDVIEELQRVLYGDGSPLSLIDDGTIEGTVTDLTLGEGAPGVPVEILRCTSAPAAAPPPRTGGCTTFSGAGGDDVTEPDGSFLFQNLDEGVYQVEITPPPGMVGIPPSQLVLLAGDLALATADFSMDVPVIGAVTGTVTAEGAGLSGVGVTLVGLSTQSATTGAGGSYAFPNVLGGNYSVAIDASGYPDVAFPATAAITGITADGQTAVVDFAGTYFRTATITGQATVGGVGIMGITVTATGPEGSMAAVTDAFGNYLFDFLLAGAYTVTLSSIPAPYTCAPNPQNVVLSTGENLVVSYPCT